MLRRHLLTAQGQSPDGAAFSCSSAIHPYEVEVGALTLDISAFGTVRRTLTNVLHVFIIQSVVFSNSSSTEQRQAPSVST